jgi:hypothetical protein
MSGPRFKSRLVLAEDFDNPRAYAGVICLYGIEYEIRVENSRKQDDGRPSVSVSMWAKGAEPHAG